MELRTERILNHSKGTHHTNDARTCEESDGESNALHHLMVINNQ